MAGQHNYRPIKGDNMKRLRKTALDKVKSIFPQARTYIEVIGGLGQWDENVCNTNKARQVRDISDKVMAASKITGQQLDQLKENLVVIWAMQSDSELLPNKVEFPRGKMIPWFQALVAELRRATQNETGHFIYFPNNKSHQPGMDGPDPVQHMNDAIRQYLSDIQGETSLGPMQSTTVFKNEDDYGDDVTSVTPLPCKRQSGQQLMQPNKWARVSKPNIAATGPLASGHEHAAYTAGMAPMRPPSGQASATGMHYTRAQSTQPGTHQGDSYSTMKAKAKNWMEACDKAKKRADEQSAKHEKEVTSMQNQMNNLNKQLAEARAAHENQLAITAEKDEQIATLNAKLASSQQGLRQERGKILQLGRTLRGAAHGIAAEMDKFLDDNGAHGADCDTDNAGDDVKEAGGQSEEDGTMTFQDDNMGAAQDLGHHNSPVTSIEAPEFSDGDTGIRSFSRESSLVPDVDEAE